MHVHITILPFDFRQACLPICCCCNICKDLNRLPLLIWSRPDLYDARDLPVIRVEVRGTLHVLNKGEAVSPSKCVVTVIVLGMNKGAL